MTKTHHFQDTIDTKKLRKMSGEEGIAVASLPEKIFVEKPEKQKKIGEQIIVSFSINKYF